MERGPCTALAVALLSAMGTSLPARAAAQQVADTTFQPAPSAPAYAPGTGPRVAIDEAHHDFHTVGGPYRPFAELLRRDGYRVAAFGAPFTVETLRGVDVLVVANALAARNESDWSLPTPSAFTPEEIAAVRAWVAGGGSLLLVADHMPFAGAAAELAAAFGIRWLNGFALEGESQDPMAFRRADGTLAPHPMREGRSADERIDSVFSFVGSAFRMPAGGRPVLILRSGVLAVFPQEAWRFTEATPRRSAAGWLQGGTLVVGRGRVAAFGEAAMFSAQTADGRPMGMNHPLAAQNWRLVLNAMHWLSGLLPPR